MLTGSAVLILRRCRRRGGQSHDAHETTCVIGLHGDDKSRPCFIYELMLFGDLSSFTCRPHKRGWGGGTQVREAKPGGSSGLRAPHCFPRALQAPARAAASFAYAAVNGNVLGWGLGEERRSNYRGGGGAVRGRSRASVYENTSAACSGVTQRNVRGAPNGIGHSA